MTAHRLSQAGERASHEDAPVVALADERAVSSLPELAPAPVERLELASWEPAAFSGRDG